MELVPERPPNDLAARRLTRPRPLRRIFSERDDKVAELVLVFGRGAAGDFLDGAGCVVEVPAFFDGDFFVEAGALDQILYDVLN